MKSIRNIIIVVLVFMGVGYCGQAMKAVKVKQVRLEFALQEGKITKQQFNTESQNVSFVKTLLDPKFVLSVD